MHKSSLSYLQKSAYASTPLEPAETKPRSNFPESRVESSFSKVQSAKRNSRRNKINGWHRIFWPNRSSTTWSHTCQHHADITQFHTFAALIRLSTTTRNLLTLNISEISSNKHLWTFLLHSSYRKSSIKPPLSNKPPPSLISPPFSEEER